MPSSTIDCSSTRISSCRSAATSSLPQDAGKRLFEEFRRDHHQNLGWSWSTESGRRWRPRPRRMHETQSAAGATLARALDRERRSGEMVHGGFTSRLPLPGRRRWIPGLASSCHRASSRCMATCDTGSASRASVATAGTEMPRTVPRPTFRRATRRSSPAPPIPWRATPYLNHESEEFIRFVQIRAICAWPAKACGKCHAAITGRVQTSSMAHGAMIPQAGLCNNGIHDARRPVFGEAYMPDGTPARSDRGGAHPTQVPPEFARTSLVTKLEPLPQFEMVPATDPFRVLERGNSAAGQRGPRTGLPHRRGGIVLHKTRLNGSDAVVHGHQPRPRVTTGTAVHRLSRAVRERSRHRQRRTLPLAQFYRAGGSVRALGFRTRAR